MAGAATIDLRAMIAPVGVLPVAVPIVPLEEIVAQEPRRLASLFAFGLIATILLMTGATTTAYGVRMASATKRVAAAVTAPTLIKPSTSSSAPLAATSTSSGLQDLLDTFTANDRNDWGIIVKNLSTGETGTINPSTQIESASLYKLFVAQGIYKGIDTAKYNYSSAAGGGSGMNIATCLKYMITISDNTCGRALGQLQGWEAMNPSLRAAGYTVTDMTGPYQETSAADVGLLLERIYDGTLASPNSTAAFLDLLKGQLVNNRLPQGLPVGTVIAHKTGDLDGYTHDAGIVYGPKADYLVVVMSGPWASPDAQTARFAQLSAQLYSYIER